MPIKTARAVVQAAMLTALVACGSENSGPSEPASGSRGLVVLLASESSGAWPTGLDPATSTTSTINLSLMNAVFGGLFQLAPTEAANGFSVKGVLAESYAVRDEGRTIAVTLREGLEFSDGTPLDAEALAFNIERALGSPCVCAPTSWPWAEDEPVTRVDGRTVLLNFSRPYPAAINAFPSTNINWPVSPAAIAHLSEDELKLAPIGAGPFRIVANEVSSKLVLERNPSYWQQDRPYLDRLVFQSIGSEQAAYLALLAGDAHVYEGMTSPRLVAQAEKNERVKVTRQPATSPLVIQLNSKAPPFEERRAREAIYHATDVEAIRTALFGGRYPKNEMFTAPGGLFYSATVSGYRQHDPERARALVTELGGLKITLGTLRSAVLERVITALQTQWQAAGIEVEIETHELASLVQIYQATGWDAMLQTVGSYDPESIAGVSSRFRSNRPFSGVADAALDEMINRAASLVDASARAALYRHIGEYISNEAYAPFLFAVGPAQLTVPEVEGPGLTTPIPPVLVNTGILWQEVRFTAEE